MGEIQICLVHVDMYQKSIDKRRKTKSINGREFEETNDVHCSLQTKKLGKSESTISQHEQEMLDLELDYGIDVPRVEWSESRFSTPTR